jgi:capsular polysaccharide transport system permease protein
MADVVPRKNFSEALRVQLRVLWALLLREMSLRMGPYRFGHLLVLTETIWSSMVIGLIWYAIGHPPPYGKNVIFYIFTGMFPYTFYRTLHSRVGAALEANRALLSYPVVRPVDTLLARAGLEISLQFISLLVFYWAFIALQQAKFPAKPLELLEALGATILLGFGLGVSSMIIRSIWRPWNTIDNMISRVLFFVSGIFYQVEYLPKFIRDVIVWNPLVHAIEWVRYSIYPNYFTQTLDREYLLAWGVLATVFGLAMERLRRSRLLEA